MLKKFPVLICLFVSVFSSNELFSNRFANKNPNEVAGCAAMSDEEKKECPSMNDQWYDQGCITAEERDTLNANRWLATCKGKKLLTFCHWSCFDPSVRILVENLTTGTIGYVAVGSLPQNGSGYRIQVVSEGVIKNLPFEIMPCRVREVIVFTLENGSILKVTQEHPILLASGEMIQAKEIIVGSKLLNQARQSIEVLSISTEMSSGEVLNILVDEENAKMPHTIVAEGVLVGDAQWQRVLLGTEPQGQDYD